MTEYTVTGIRYVLGEGHDFEERTQLAKDFVKGLKPGTKAILQAEPDNPMDENAIMVFVDYKICGYIGREQCLEVKGLLNEDGQADAVVTRNDEELAFFVNIPGTEVRRVLPSVKERQLPDSPLGLHVRIPFTYDVKTLEMLANRLVGMDVKSDSVADFIDMVERYEPLLDAAICNRDEQQMSAIFDLLKSVLKRKDELGLSGQLLERAQCVHKLLHTRVRNSHRRWKKEYEKKFAEHFNRLRANSDVCTYFFEKYCESYLSVKTFSEADKDKMRSERKRLLMWFEGLEWSELKNPKDMEKISMKLNYLRVSRFEIYDVFSVLLVLGELDKYLQAATTPQNELSVAPLGMMQPESYTNTLPQKKKSFDKKISSAPKTLQYFVSGQKGMLREQQRRVEIIFKKFNEWGWIGSKTTSYDFNSLFTGEDRHCNIVWKKNSTVLSVLLRRMLNYKNRHEENLIVAQTGQSATSMVNEQFNLTPNFDQNRLTEDDKFKIMLTLFVLDVQNPLPLRYGGSDNDYDVSDAAFQEVLAGQLRITKGI